MRTILLSQGEETFVDDEDFRYLEHWKWSVSKSNRSSYVFVDGKWKIVRMHRMILNAPKGMEIDHIDHNGLNNQKLNLRICTKGQNGQNQRKQERSTHSKYKGVSWHKGICKWTAQIRQGKNLTHLGSFDCEVEAAKAYDYAAICLFGEFAHINFDQVMCSNKGI